MARNISVLFLLAILCSVILFAVACGDDDDDSNDDGDDDDDDDDDSGDDDDDFNLSDPLGPGEVRAGQITAEDELIGGPRARGEIGDYKIYNSQVEFIIRSPEHPGIGWTTASGMLIDADRARPPEEEGADGLWAHEQLAGIIRSLRGTAIEVPETGEAGRALVRVTGRDGGIDIVDGIVPFRDAGLDFATEYILEPDVDYLTILTTVTDRSGKARKVFIADVCLWGDEMRPFTPRAGFETGEVDLLGGLRWVGGISAKNLPVSYAMATPVADETFWVPYSDDELLPLVQGFRDVEAFGQIAYKRIFIVGDGGTSGINSTLNAYDGVTEFGTLTGRVDIEGDEDGDMDGVEVLITDDRPDGENAAGVVVPDSAGEFSIELPYGTYALTASGPGRVDSPPVAATVAAGESTPAVVALDPPGLFEYTVVDGTGGLTPSKLFFQPGHDAGREAGITRRVWSVSGTGSERVLPGAYTVTASRGFEYEIDRQNVTITAGEITTFDAQIVRSVDTTGYMTGDFHIHSQFSIDSQVLAQTRVRELVSAGIEMPVFTDHDTASNYTPYVAELGLGDYIHPIAGTEVSPYYGHFNSWPMTPPSDAPDYYGVPLAEYDTDHVAVRAYQHPDMWDIARDRFGAQIIQINHPRAGSAAWFDHVGYDPAVGVSSVDPERWRDDFDVIEVFNSGGDHEGTLEDWFSFLDQGLTYTMTGNSDSHTTTSELGNPRNVFAMPTDDPGEADTQDLIDSILAHKNVVSIGPFITFSIAGESIGGFVAVEAGTDVELAIRVQAPLWMDVDYLRIWTNHQALVEQIDLTPTGTVVRYDDTITLAPVLDSYYVIETGHTSATLGPVNRGERVFAITNPIWVDRDGNGVFDAPGLTGSAYGVMEYESSHKEEPGLPEYLLSGGERGIEYPR